MIPDDGLTSTPILPKTTYSKLQKELRMWWKKNKRQFLWRESNEPYLLFVAEFMLQKTQVAKVEKVYAEFIKSYPSVQDLASASSRKLKKIFSWLGLVKRADFIKKSAKIIVSEFGGNIPQDPNDLLELPGIGRYTANAISCFGFGQAHPVVDTTIARVLKRLLGFQTQKSAWDDQVTWDVADEFLNRENPLEHNYALIDLAATICLPRDPLCEVCPVQRFCVFANRK